VLSKIIAGVMPQSLHEGKDPEAKKAGVKDKEPPVWTEK
jgi:hypothetical protein